MEPTTTTEAPSTTTVAPVTTTTANPCPRCPAAQSPDPANNCQCTCAPDETLCLPGAFYEGSPATCFACPPTYVPHQLSTCTCDCPENTSPIACVRSGGGFTGSSRCCGENNVCVDDACVACPAETTAIMCTTSTGAATSHYQCCDAGQRCTQTGSTPSTPAEYGCV